jgi:hypothetical protein
MSSEKAIEQAMRVKLEQMGCLVIKMHLGPVLVRGGMRVKNPNAGFPDLFGWLPNGRGFAIEVKKPKTGRISEEQTEWLKALNDYNVLAFRCEDPVVAATLISEAMSESFC